jgi:hypothetical protein
MQLGQKDESFESAENGVPGVIKSTTAPVYVLRT